MVWLFLIVRCGVLVERPNENKISYAFRASTNGTEDNLVITKRKHEPGRRELHRMVRVLARSPAQHEPRIPMPLA
jgi:hypothetical protein